jgi:hypothetical protein
MNVLRKGKRDERPRNPEGLYTNKPLKEHYVAQIAACYDYSEDADPQWAQEQEARLLAKEKVEELERKAKELKLVVYGNPSKIQPQPNLRRYTIERTAKQQRHQLERIVDDVLVMTAVREGVIPVLKAPGKLCGWCDFFQLCQLDEDMGDVDSMKDALFKRLDPYHDHRPDATNSKLSVAADK